MDKKWRKSIFQLLPLDGRYFLTVALNTFFPAWVDSPSLLNGSGDNFFQRTAQTVRADNNFFSERIAWVTRTDDMTFLFGTDSPSCSRDVCKQIVDNMFDSSFRRFLVSLRCFVPSSRRPGVVVSLFRFVTWHVVLFEVLFRCFV